MRLLSQLILPRHKYLYFFTLSTTNIMCKFAKLTKTHRKVDPELPEYFFGATKRNIFSNFEQSQCLL